MFGIHICVTERFSINPNLIANPTEWTCKWAFYKIKDISQSLNQAIIVIGCLHNYRTALLKICSVNEAVEMTTNLFQQNISNN